MKGKGKIFIQGDFNARVGDCIDYIYRVNLKDNLFDSSSTKADKPLPFRNLEDNKSNHIGTLFLQSQ